MIGLILHKNKHLGAIKGNNIDKSILSSYGSYCNNSSKQESRYVSEKGQCVSNAIDNLAEHIFKLFMANGSLFLEKLRLEFSFGLFDNSRNVFFGARDRMGIKPFYYYNSDDIFIYSTDIKFIKEQLSTCNLDKDWIVSTLTGTVFDRTTSQIEGINKLAPAHYLVLENGKLTITKYWELQKQVLPPLSEAIYIQELKKSLVSAVENRMANNVGTELSGGLDSSAIAGILAEKNKQVLSYSHTLAKVFHDKVVPYKDERIYRDLVIEKYPNIEVRNIDAANKGLFYELQDELKRQAVPLSNTLAYLSDGIFDRAKEDQVDTLFSGFGGDEGISNYAHILPYQYAKQFNLASLKEAIGTAYLSKKFIKSLIKPNLPFLKRAQNNWRADSYNMLFINEGFVKENNLDRIYWEYHNNRKVKTLDEYLLMKLNENYISNRTESTGASARMRGIEYTFPLLDVDLIEYYYSMPNYLKYKGGVGRYAFREIIKDFVPEKIYRRADKTGATVPNVLVRFMKDYKLIEEYLQSVRNGKASEYIDFDKMIANMDIIKQYSEGKRVRANQHIFFNALMLALYLEGEY